MSYQVIARKWRPQIFEEVIGQEAVTQTLRNAIEHDRLHHAYIFSGARGVGKTTTARLLAKALNCRKNDKPNSTPCDTSKDDACVSCQEVSESRSMDVLEFDAASHTKVEEIREIILESINVNPARDRYKIFIIDEVHMLSKSSFNALLKTLEEPPSNVVFVMATTELHKVPDTILSRVQEFEFRTIPLQKILNRLKTIADADKINISDSGLKEIARSGEGSMRDAQSNFDQVISFSGEKIETDDVLRALGIASAENLTNTIRAITEKKPQEVLKVVDDLIARGQDLRHFCTDLLTFIRDLLVFKTAGDAENLLDTAILGFDDLKKYSEPFTEGDLIRLFNSLANTESKLREANEPRYILEIGLIKLIEMGRVQPVEQILERLLKLESILRDTKVDPETFETESKPAEPIANTEKKTLKPDFPIDEVPFPVKNEKIEMENGESSVNKGADEQVRTENSFDATAESNENSIEVLEDRNDLGEDEPEYFDETPPFDEAAPASPEDNYGTNKTDSDKTSSIINIDAMPVKLEPIESEDLEHIDDKWLDKTFEYKLQHEGDDLRAIPNATKIIELLLSNQGYDTQVKAEVEISTQANGSAAATARTKHNKALDIVTEMTTYEEIDETIPELSANPTQEELFIFAQNHPSVKKVIRVFRGKLIKVEKKEEEK